MPSNSLKLFNLRTECIKEACEFWLRNKTRYIFFRGVILGDDFDFRHQECLDFIGCEIAGT